jgi:putative two-component system response regulator
VRSSRLSRDLETATVAVSARVLVVDDLESNRHLLARYLSADGFRVEFAANGEDALRRLPSLDPDLILMDVLMPGISGLEVCRAVKANPATRLIPVVLITALHESADRVRGLDAGADDFVSKPFNPHELRARVRSLLRIKRYTDDLDSAESVILSLASTIEARDRATEGHCQRLARYAGVLGRAIGLDEADLATLTRGAYLHDIGKIAVPDAVLLKPARLTAAEFELMKQHTVIGDRLCSELRALRRVRPIVRHHHERLDGSGYPDALAGAGIPLLAQIIGIVDVFDALTTERPYKPALPPAAAAAELRHEVARGWRDRGLVAAFLREVERA